MLIPADMMTEQVEKYYANGLPSGVSTGWTTLDGFYSVKRGEMTVVTGIPGHGKSEWLDALSINLAKNHNWKFAVFSPENHPIELHISKLMEKYVGKPFERGPTDRMTGEESIEALAWIGQRFFFINPENITINGILDEVQGPTSIGKWGIIIDPWNEVDHQRPDGLSETEYISQSLSVIRRFAREQNAHIWLVAHPTKLARDRDGKYPVPSPYDISGSAHWRNKADNCITVWRDVVENNQSVDIHIQKVRFKQVGRVGLVTLLYDRITGRYMDKRLSVVQDYKSKAAHDESPI